jgi:hypothetical protein
MVLLQISWRRGSRDSRIRGVEGFYSNLTAIITVFDTTVILSMSLKVKILMFTFLI